MNLRRFDLNLLPLLDALLSERNVTRAGERVFLSQSAMSGALAKLRYLCNDPLLVRDGREFALTPRAEELDRELRALLPRLNNIVKPAPEFDPATAEHAFTMQLSDYATTVLMPEVLRRLRAEAPGVSIEILPPSGKRPREAIVDQIHDLVIIPAEYAAANHPMEQLLVDRWVCVVSADVEEYADGISLDQYLGARHIAVCFGDGAVPAIEGWHLQKHGYSRSNVLRLPYLVPPGGLVEGSDFISITPERLARIWAKVYNLRILPTPYDIPNQVLHMQWHARESDNQALAWMRGVFHEAARSLGPAGED